MEFNLVIIAVNENLKFLFRFSLIKNNTAVMWNMHNLYMQLKDTLFQN